MRRGILITGLTAAWLLLFHAGSVSSEVITFPEGLKRATEENRLIKITQKEEALSEQDTLAIRSALLPNVNTTLTQTILAYQPQAIFGSFIVPTSDKNFLSFSISIQQLLFDFQRTASRYESARSLFETRRFDTKRVRNLVALDYATVYFDLLESEKMVGVAEREVESLNAHLHDAQALFDNGVITRNDLLQTGVRLSDAQQRLLTARNMRSLQVSRLNIIMSLPVDADTQVTEVSSIPLYLVGTDKAGSWELALKERPEIQIVDKTMEAIGFEEQSVKAEYLPQFFARGSFDYTENRYLVHENNWGLVLGMNMNIFSGGATKAELSKVRVRREQLLEQRKKLTDDIKLEVEKYYLETKNAAQKISVTAGAVSQAEENHRINRVRYEEGIGTSTDVIDAITLLTVAETNYYRALYDLRRAEAGLVYATGVDIPDVYGQ